MTQRLSKDEQNALEHFVHTPGETATNYVRFAKEINTQAGITFGCQLDKYLIPLRPGRKLGIIGRPGMGKTTLGGYLVLREARRILAHGLQNQLYAAHVTWEQSVEELEAMYQTPEGYGVTDVAWGRVPVEQVIRDSLKRPSLPVWLFGESLYKTNLDTPLMTVETVYHAMRAVWKERKMLPSILFFDFIQNIPVPDERDRYMQVSSAMRKVSRMALQVNAPLVLGIQANQRVDDYKVPLPSMRDSEWSAVIGQLLDVLIAVWKPIRTYLPHQEEFINVGGMDYPNTDDLLVIKLLKQRFEKGYGIWAQRFDQDGMTLDDYKVERINLNDY